MSLPAKRRGMSVARFALPIATWAQLAVACLFLAGVWQTAFAAAETRQDILVISSYHTGLPWTDGQVAGLRDGFANASPPVELHIEFLDTKRTPPSPAYLAQAARLFDGKYRQNKPALIVAQDDDALDFALLLRKPGQLFHGIPLVFSGVAGERAASLKTESDITGVFDDADISSNIALLRRLIPGLQRVVFIHDQSRTGLAQARGAAMLARENSDLAFEFLSDRPAPSIQHRLTQLDTKSGVILLTFNRDSENRTLTHAEASQLWAAASAAPVLAKEDGMVVPGVLGGQVVSSHRQGFQAATLAQRILAGENPATIPPAGGQTEAIFEYPTLVRFGIDEQNLPSGAEIRNKPQSLRQTHPREFWLSTALIGSLGLIVILLISLTRRSHRAQLALARSERNYREILAATNEAIIIQAADGSLIEANESFCRLYGYSTDEAHQLSIGDLSSNTPPYTQADAARCLEQALERGVHIFEWHARHKNGHLFWVEVALRTAEIGGEFRLVAAVRDIEERKQAESALRASEERYRLLLRHSPVGIVHFDLDLKITYANDRFSDILHAQRDRMIGLSLNLVRDQSPIPACRKATTGMPGYYEGEYQSTLSGHTTWVSFRTAPAINSRGAVIGGIGIVEDISARIAAEKAVLRLNEDLEQRVEERTNALLKANADIQAAMKQLAQSERLAALGNLVAGVAHELNTPLGNANTVASTLRDRIKELGASIDSAKLTKNGLQRFMTDSSDAAALIERNIERAAELINSFKQVAVDQTSIRRRRFDLAQAMEEMLSTLRPRIKRTAHRVQVDIPGGIMLDSYPGPLEQIVSNLVLNSLTHAFGDQPNGKIHLAAHCAGEQVIIEYRDNGRGMDETEASRAFDPFFTTRLGTGGSGLGLYITRNLASDVLGGSIELETARGSGTHFTLHLPLIAPFALSEPDSDSTDRQ